MRTSSNPAPPPVEVGMSKYVVPSFVNCQESPVSFHRISTLSLVPLSTLKKALSVGDPLVEESMVMVCPVRDRVDPVAAPIFGVVKVGVLAKTKDPVPVSSDITVISSAEVVAAKSESLFNVVVIVPVVGRVTFVDAVVVKVSAYAPEVVRFPPSVIVLFIVVI